MRMSQPSYKKDVCAYMYVVVFKAWSASGELTVGVLRYAYVHLPEMSVRCQAVYRWS